MKKFLLLLASGYLLFVVVLSAAYAQGIKEFADAWPVCLFGIFDSMLLISCIKSYWSQP